MAINGDWNCRKTGMSRSNSAGAAALGDQDTGVARGIDPQIAMHGLRSMEKDRRGSRAGQRGRDFLADVTGFADAADHDLTGVFQQQLHGFAQVMIQTVRHRRQSFSLGFQHRLGNFPPIRGK